MPKAGRLYWLTLTLLGLAGCTNKPAQPGDEIAVTCHGQEWVQCFQKADKRCGSGRYQLVSQLTDAGSSSGNNDSLIHGTFIQRTLVARCTDGKSPSEKQNPEQSP